MFTAYLVVVDGSCRRPGRSAPRRGLRFSKRTIREVPGSCSCSGVRNGNNGLCVLHELRAGSANSTKDDAVASILKSAEQRAPGAVNLPAAIAEDGSPRLTSSMPRLVASCRQPGRSLPRGEWHPVRHDHRRRRIHGSQAQRYPSQTEVAALNVPPPRIPDAATKKRGWHDRLPAKSTIMRLRTR